MTQTTPAAACRAIPPRSRPWTVRAAGWSASHRWPVFVLWFVATIGLFAGSLAAGGTNAADAVSNEQRSKYEAGEAGVLFNASGTEAPSQQFLLILSGDPGRPRRRRSGRSSPTPSPA